MDSRFGDIKRLNPGMGCCLEDYIFIYGLITILQPKNIVEIGTNYGMATITMALALKENGINGHIDTFDIAPSYIEIAKKQVKEMGLEDFITFHKGTSDIAKNLGKKFDFTFIDGDHTYEGIKTDLDNLKNISDYILFHDIDACSGVKKFVEELNEERVKITKRPPGHNYENNNWRLNSYFNGVALWRKT